MFWWKWVEDKTSSYLGQLPKLQSQQFLLIIQLHTLDVQQPQTSLLDAKVCVNSYVKKEAVILKTNHILLQSKNFPFCL